jgi:hypothetical protein
MKFDEWFDQQEGYATRAERFYEDLEWNDYEKIKDWLLAAYNEGLREGLATPVPSNMPSWPNPPRIVNNQDRCIKCGIPLSGIMGYTCVDTMCPTFVKAYSGPNSQVTHTTGQFSPFSQFGTKTEEGYNG